MGARRPAEPDAASRSPGRPGSATSGWIDGPVLTPDTDFTGKVRLRCPAVRARDRSTASRSRTSTTRGCAGEPEVGSFRTAPLGRRDVSFAWSADLAGQGWGINPDLGGYRIFSDDGALEPDFFLCSGDHVYADGPLTVDRAAARRAHVAQHRHRGEGEGRRDARRVPRPVRLQPARRQPARVRRRASRRSTSGTTTRSATTGTPARSSTDERYTERNVDVLAARARQAFFEWLPIGPNRSTRRVGSTAGSRTGRCSTCSCSTCGPTRTRTTTTATPTRSAGCSARAQRAWLKRELAASHATWKVIANDLPLGLVVPDGAAFEGVAQGDAGRAARARARVRGRALVRAPARRRAASSS